MAVVTFIEKPGCINNTRQKQLLKAAGHTLIVKDLLREPWTEETLFRFLSVLPVKEWFNSSAPKIKSGEIDPETLDEVSALKRMIDDPLLIRRPLMMVKDQCMVGFDPVKVDAWIGLEKNIADQDYESCPRE